MVNLYELSLEVGEEVPGILSKLRDLPKEKRPRGIGFVVAGPKVFESFSSQPCHGALSGNAPIGTVVATFLNKNSATGMTAYPEICYNDGAAETFFSWLARQSVYRGFILNPDTIIEDGFLAVNHRGWFPMVNTVNIIGRTYTEKPWKINAFADLVSKGIPPEVAFAIGFGTGYGYRRHHLKDPSNQGVFFETSHTPLIAMEVCDVVNFFTGVCPGYDTDPKRSYADGYRGYFGGTASWRSSTAFPNTYDKAIVEAAKSTTKLTFTNPFAKKTVAASSFDINTWDSTIIPGLVDVFNATKKDSRNG